MVSVLRNVPICTHSITKAHMKVLTRITTKEGVYKEYKFIGHNHYEIAQLDALFGTKTTWAIPKSVHRRETRKRRSVRAHTVCIIVRDRAMHRVVF